MSDPIKCAKCGGCPAYGVALLCLFCEDGVPCPCGGWQRALKASAQQQPARRVRATPPLKKPKPIRPEVRPVSTATFRRRAG